MNRLTNTDPCRACLRRTAKRLKSWTGLRADPEMKLILRDIRLALRPKK